MHEGLSRTIDRAFRQHENIRTVGCGGRDSNPLSCYRTSVTLYHTPNPTKKNRGIVRSFRLELQKLLDAQSWVQLRAKTNLERCLRDL